jgi:excisionase family DNA binding protein
MGQISSEFSNHFIHPDHCVFNTHNVMEGYVIITGKEDLKQIVKEVLAELIQPVQSDSANPKYLDMDKLLDFLHQNNCRISKSQIYKLTRSRKIPHRKVGKNLLFNRDEILDWLQGETSRKSSCRAGSPIPQAKVVRR